MQVCVFAYAEYTVCVCEWVRMEVKKQKEKWGCLFLFVCVCAWMCCITACVCVRVLARMCVSVQYSHVSVWMSGLSGWQAAAALWYEPSCTDISADILGFATHPRPPGKVMVMAAAVVACPSTLASSLRLSITMLCFQRPQPGPNWTHYSTQQRRHHMTHLARTPYSTQTLIPICTSTPSPLISSYQTDHREKKKVRRGWLCVLVPTR